MHDKSQRFPQFDDSKIGSKISIFLIPLKLYENRFFRSFPQNHTSKRNQYHECFYSQTTQTCGQVRGTTKQKFEEVSTKLYSQPIIHIHTLMLNTIEIMVDLRKQRYETSIF